MCSLNYGTIIVDLERRKVIDLLPNRESDTLSQWLLRHPEIHTVGRDRAGAYSKGIKDGTANAIEVADRFHLLVNLREAFQKTLYRHNPALKKAFTEYGRPNIAPVTDRTGPVPEGSSGPDTLDPERRMKFERAKELAGQGYSLKAIAGILGAHRRTVRKYIRSEEFPRRQAPPDPMTNFLEFRDYLFEFYKDFDYRTLYANIRGQGFNGKYTQFCHNMNRFSSNLKSPAYRDYRP